MRIRSWLIAAACLSGCHLDVSFDDSRFFCGGGGSCPADQSCVQDYCQATKPPGADAALLDDAAPLADADPGIPDARVSTIADSGATTPDAPPPPPPDAAPPPDAMPVCNLGHIADNFADGVTAPFWVAFNESPTTENETNGRLVITLQAGTAGSHFAGYVHATNTDGRGQHTHIELAVAPNSSSFANAFFKVQNADNFNNEATFILENGTLYMDTYDVNNTRLSRRSLTFNASNHRFWALEESNGKVSFLTSPDGSTWTLRDQEIDPFPFQNARVAFGGGTWRAETNPGSIQFEGLNSGPSTNCFGIPQ
jgi:hypothetical protein